MCFVLYGIRLCFNNYGKTVITRLLKNKSVFTRSGREGGGGRISFSHKRIHYKLNHVPFICLTAKESTFIKRFLNVSTGPISAFAFLNWTTEQHNNPRCPNYTCRLNPHSDMQPVFFHNFSPLTPYFLYSTSYVQQQLCTKKRTPKFNLHAYSRTEFKTRVYLLKRCKQRFLHIFLKCIISSRWSNTGSCCRSSLEQHAASILTK